LDELKHRFRSELVELRQRLLALFPFELAGVVEDEAVDNLFEAGVLFLAEQRQARGERVGLLRRRLAGRQENRQTQERVRHGFLAMGDVRPADVRSYPGAAAVSRKNPSDQSYGVLGASPRRCASRSCMRR